MHGNPTRTNTYTYRSKPLPAPRITHKKCHGTWYSPNTRLAAARDDRREKHRKLVCLPSFWIEWLSQPCYKGGKFFVNLSSSFI